MITGLAKWPGKLWRIGLRVALGINRRDFLLLGGTVFVFVPFGKILDTVSSFYAAANGTGRRVLAGAQFQKQFRGNLAGARDGNQTTRATAVCEA